MVYNHTVSFFIKGFCMISDSQIFIALLFALISAVLAIRLGIELY